MFASMENSERISRPRRKKPITSEKAPPEPEQNGKRTGDSNSNKTGENVSPKGKKMSSKRGMKRKLDDSPAPVRFANGDCPWKLAAEMVAREKVEMDAKEQLLAEQALEEDYPVLEPFRILGLQDSPKRHRSTSIEAQEFRASIADHYLKGESCPSFQVNMEIDRVDNPFQPEIIGARKRKTVFGKLKFMDLASSKPFDKFHLYNLCASKRDSHGFDEHLLQWFAQVPQP